MNDIVKELREQVADFFQTPLEEISCDLRCFVERDDYRWRAADELARLRAVNAELLAALKKAEGFVDAHSEEWYMHGQDLLKEIRAAIANAEKVT